MTNEEMERAIDFLLKSQANFEARLARQEIERAQRDARIDERHELTNQQIAETEKKIGMFADLQAEFMQLVTRTFDEQARINKSVAEALTRLAESQTHTDRRLDALIDIVRGGRNGE